MNIIPFTRCIICLEEDAIKNDNYGLVSLPCHCKAFIHPNCFKKLRNDKCLICKQPYKYSEKNKHLEQISSKFHTIEINSSHEIRVEESRRSCETIVIFKFIKYITYMVNKISKFKNCILLNLRNRNLISCHFIKSSSEVLIITIL